MIVSRNLRGWLVVISALVILGASFAASVAAPPNGSQAGGDVVVSETLTAVADVWSLQLHGSYFGVIGAIDLIVQIDPNSIEFTRKEKGHADIWKALLGMGSKMFEDGQLVSVYVKNDASGWK